MLTPINFKCPNCGRSDYMRQIEGPGVGRLNIKCINCNTYYEIDDILRHQYDEDHDSEEDPIRDEVLYFIDRFRTSNKHPEIIEDIFSNGYCYYFSIILQDRFGGEILYDPIEGHFVLYRRNHLYDITGDVTNKYTVDNLYDKEDWMRNGSTIRGCILKMKKEE